MRPDLSAAAAHPRLLVGGAARWARLLAAAGYACRRPLLRRRVGKLALERVDGVPILVLPEVFNPSLFRTGAWLARAVPRPAEGAPAAPLPGAPRALDMGTGSGIGAVFAARLGYQVTAVDVNPQAVRCVRLNAMIHGLEELAARSRRYSLSMLVPMGQEMAYRYQEGVIYETIAVLREFLLRSRAVVPGE